MTVQEKKVMRRALMRVMQDAPLQEKNVRQPQVSPINIFIFLLRNPLSVALTLALVIGSSVSFAAEGSLPGDLLYPVKILLNEEVRGTLTITSEAKAEWETERAERRLAEAVSLSAVGKLDEEKEQKLAEQLEKHVQKVADRVMELEERNPELADEVTSRFETSLEAHAEILMRLSLRNSDNKDDSTEEMLTVVQEKRRTVSSVQASPVTLSVEATQKDSLAASQDDLGISEKVTDFVEARESAVVRILKLAESKTEDVSKIIEKFEATLSTSTIIQVNADITAAKQMMSDGKVLLENKQYNEALVKFQDAFNLVYRLEILLNAEQRHKLQIFPSILPISSEKDDDDEEGSATSSVPTSIEINLHLQKEADQMKEKATAALEEAQSEFSQKIGLIPAIVNKVQNLLVGAQKASVKAGAEYIKKNYTCALRLWNISYMNAAAVSQLLSGSSDIDIDIDIDMKDRGSCPDNSPDKEVEIEID